MAQYKLFLQKSMNVISKELLDKDDDKCYEIPIDEFISTINLRMSIPHHLKEK